MKRDRDDVASHYNARPNQGRNEREESRIVQLRKFNNWIKSVLIGLYCKKGDKVFDIAGGKGGDLAKYRKSEISHYILADVAEVSVQHAKQRYSERRHDFPAMFLAGDCFGLRMFETMDPAIRFDFVSCQFAFHYSFESEARVRRALENITDRLDVGGHFVGTCINALRIAKIFKNFGHSWSNSVCALEFDKSLQRDAVIPDFGAKYTFTLVDAVGGVPEYFVHFAVLEKIAKEYGLELVMKEEFPLFYQKYKNVEVYEDLFRMMMQNLPSPPEWEAINLYLVFCFKKTVGEEKKGPFSGKYKHSYDEIIKF